MSIEEYEQAFLVDSDLITSEEPSASGNGLTWHTCGFIFTSSHKTKSGNLVVLASGETSVKASVKNSAKSCREKPKYLNDNAFSCTENEDQCKNTYLVVTRISHGQMRIAEVAAGPPPDSAHPGAYTTITKTLLGRL